MGNHSFDFSWGRLLYKDPQTGEERGLRKGDKLHVHVKTWFRVHAFNGEKHVVVSDASRLGGRNSALWIMYLITGVSSFMAGFFFLATFYRHVSQQERSKLSQERVGNFFFRETFWCNLSRSCGNCIQRLRDLRLVALNFHFVWYNLNPFSLQAETILETNILGVIRESFSLKV